jgi:hypothetical protein
MSTHARIYVVSKGHRTVRLYRHYDGNPEVTHLDLIDKVSTIKARTPTEWAKKLVHIPTVNPYIEQIKEETGKYPDNYTPHSAYGVVPNSDADLGEEYQYTVNLDTKGIGFKKRPFDDVPKHTCDDVGSNLGYYVQLCEEDYTEGMEKFNQDALKFFGVDNIQHKDQFLHIAKDYAMLEYCDLNDMSLPLSPDYQLDDAGDIQDYLRILRDTMCDLASIFTGELKEY